MAYAETSKGGGLQVKIVQVKITENFCKLKFKLE